MTREFHIMLKLLMASAEGVTVAPELEDHEWERLFELSRKRGIAALIGKKILDCPGNAKQEILAKFKRIYNMELYRYNVQKAESDVLFDAMENAGIDNMLLKGDNLRSLYPSPELRSSCDVDILYRCGRDRIAEFMSEQGYELVKTTAYDDEFYKKPVMNVEMHHNAMELFSDYYAEIWNKAVPEEGKSHSYRLGDSDNYIYAVAHFAKHLNARGTGVRSVFDIYLFRRGRSSTLDYEYINAELEKLGLLKLETALKKLISFWFEGGAADDTTLLFSDAVLGADVYGSEKIKIKKRINIDREAGSRYGYIFKRLFPPYRKMCIRYPFLEKVPFMLPLMWPVRFFDIFRKRKKIMWELGKANDISSEELCSFRELYDYLGMK